MQQGTTVQVSISFEALTAAVNGLSLADKIRLWDLLEAQIAAAEDDDPAVRAAVQQALDEYEAGDTVTLDALLQEA